MRLDKKRIHVESERTKKGKFVIKVRKKKFKIFLKILNPEPSLPPQSLSSAANNNEDNNSNKVRSNFSYSRHNLKNTLYVFSACFCWAQKY